MTTEPQLPLLAKVLEKMDNIVTTNLQSPVLSLLLAAGVGQLDLSITADPDNPLVKQVTRTARFIDVLEMEITACLAELVRHQHDGEMPEDTAAEWEQLQKSRAKLIKEYVEL